MLVLGEIFIEIKNNRVIKEKAGLLKERVGNLYLQSEDVADVLNEYFVSIFRHRWQ